MAADVEGLRVGVLATAHTCQRDSENGNTKHCVVEMSCLFLRRKCSTSAHAADHVREFALAA